MRFLKVDAVNDGDVRDSIERLLHILKSRCLTRVTIAFDTDRVIEVAADGALIVYDRTWHHHFARLVSRVVDSRVRPVKWALHTMWNNRGVIQQAKRSALRAFWWDIEYRLDKEAVPLEDVIADIRWIHQRSVAIGDYELAYHAFTMLFEKSAFVQKPAVTKFDRHAAN